MKCLEIPDDQVDGIACDQCEHTSYCNCKCVYQKLEQMPYAKFEQRLASFKFNVERNNDIAEVLQVIGYYRLAKSGFYFAPNRYRRDRVKCVWCGLILSSWEESDDPEKEHSYWNQYCLRRFVIAEVDEDSCRHCYTPRIHWYDHKTFSIIKKERKDLKENKTINEKPEIKPIVNDTNKLVPAGRFFAQSGRIEDTILPSASWNALHPKNVGYLFNRVTLANYTIFFYQNDFQQCRKILQQEKRNMKQNKLAVKSNRKKASYNKQIRYEAQMLKSVAGTISQASGLTGAVDTVNQTSRDMSETLAKVNGIADDMTESRIFSRVAGMTDAVHNLCGQTTNVMSSAQSLMDAAKNFFFGEQQWLHKITMLTSLSTLFCGAEFSITNCLAYFVGVCVTLHLPHNFFKDAYMEFKNFFDNRFKAQSGSTKEVELDEETNEKLSLFGAIVETFAKALDFHIPMGVVSKKLGDIGRAVTGGEKIYSILNKLFCWVRDKYYKHKFGKTYEEVTLQVQYPELEKLAECCFYVMESTPEMIKDSRKLCERIISIDTLAAEMLLSTLKQNGMATYIKTLRSNMVDLVTQARNSPAMANSERPVPFAIYLYGRPGTGKTNLTDILKARMFSKYYSKEFGRSFNHATFSRKTENEYWDGYAEQPMVCYDDIFQAVDSTAKPNPEVMEIIRVVNDDSYQLHMSAVKDKANIFFKSKLIIATSNVKNPKMMIKSINDPTAVTRRFNMALEVKVHPEYGKSCAQSNGSYYRVDENKVESLLDTNCYDLALYDLETCGNTIIKLYKPKDGKSSFDLMLEDLFDRYDKHANKGSSRSKLLANLAGEIRAGDPTAGDAIAAKIGTVEAGIPMDAHTTKSLKKAPFTPTLKAQVGIYNNTFDRARWWNEMVSGKEEESTLTWREKLEELHGSTKQMVKDMYHKTKEYAMNPFAAPIKPKLLEKWESIKEKFSNFKKHFLTWAKEYNFSYIKDKIFENVGTVFLSIVGVVGLVFGSSKLFSKFVKKNTNCIVETALVAEDLLTESSCKCTCCEFLQEYIHELDDLDNKSRIAMTLIRELLKNDKLSEEQKKKLFKLSTTKNFYNNIRKQESHSVRKARAEIASGDLRTKQAVSRHFTEMSSGDYTTKKPAVKHYTEAGSRASGDFTTKKPVNRHYAEGLDERVESLQTKYVETHETEELHLNNAEMKLKEKLVKQFPGLHSEASNSANKDQNFVEQHSKVTHRNMVYLTKTVAGVRYAINGIMIQGRVLMVNHHFLHGLNSKDGEFLINHPYRSTAGTCIRLQDCTVHRVKYADGEKMDLVMIALPNVLPSYPSIITMFALAKEMENFTEGECYLSGLDRQVISTLDGKSLRLIVRDRHITDARLVTSEVTYHLDDIRTYVTNKSICYTAPTKGGDCGSLLFSHGTAMRGRVIGVHVAGSKGSGMALTTSFELIERNLQELKSMVKDTRTFVKGSFSAQLKSETIFVSPKLSQMELNVEGDYLSIGIAEKLPRPSKTNLRTSPIYEDIYPSISKPAYLRPVKCGNEYVDPLFKGIKKSFTTQPNVDVNVLKIASHDVASMFKKTKGDINRILTYEEAIKGVEDKEYANAMCRTTSPGFPFVLEKPIGGKRKWLGHTDEWDVTNPELKARVDNIINKAKNNERSEVIFTSTLKDERRPFAKVDAIKTRVFEAGPMDYSIAVRQYFLGFVESVMRNRIRNEVCVGINAYSADWHILAMHLQKFGKHVIAGDFSNFDGSLLQIILWEILDIINGWYGDSEENQLIRRVLFEEITNTYVLVDGVIIQKTHSQPSGNPLTVIINSLFNQIVMRMAYLILKKEQGKDLRCDFQNNVYMATYGDDNLLNISPRVVEWYNQETITKALASFGLTYTDEAKSGKCVPYRTLGEVNFLKRSFVKNEDDLYTAPLDINVVREMTNWVRGNTPKASLAENASSAVMEFGLHGRDVYQQEIAKLKFACDDKRVDIRFPCYEEMRSFFALQRDQ